MKDHNDWVCNWMDRLLEQDSINAQVQKAPQTQEISSHLDQFPLLKNAPGLERQKIMESVTQLIESAEGSKHLVTLTVHIVSILKYPLITTRTLTIPYTSPTDRGKNFNWDGGASSFTESLTWLL